MLKAVLLMGILAVFLIYGCSDDNGGTPPDEGDLTDPAFLFADEVLGMHMNNLNLMSIEGIMGDIVDSVFENEVAGKLGIKLQKPSYNVVLITSSYVQDGNWYRFTDSLAVFPTSTDEPDSVLYSGTDSVAFFCDGALTAPPDLETLDSVHYKNNGTFVFYSDNTVLTIDYTSWFTVSGQFGSDLFTVDGTVDYDVSGVVEFDEEETCDGTMVLSVVYTDMDFDWTDDLIPVEGNASATATISFSCDEGISYPDVEGAWTASWALGNGSVTSTYVHGEDRWVYTESLE